jgi:hypothetical protein
MGSPPAPNSRHLTIRILSWLVGLGATWVSFEIIWALECPDGCIISFFSLLSIPLGVTAGLVSSRLLRQFLGVGHGGLRGTESDE